MPQLAERLDLANPLKLTLFWLVVCLLVCPLAGGVTMLALDPLWDAVSPLARRLAVVLFESVGGPTQVRRHVAEALGALYVAAVAAVGLAVSLGLAQPTWSERFDRLAALYPACLGVMVAPAAMVHLHGAALGAGSFEGRASSEFLTMYAAFATSIASAYAFWVLLDRAACRRSFHPADGDRIKWWV